MAYVQTTPVVRRFSVSGREFLFISFTETEASPTSEWSVTGIPPTGQVLLYHSTLTAGTGTTIQPFLGRITGFAANSEYYIGGSTTAAVSVNESSVLTYTYGVIETTQTLFGKSVPNNPAADHTIITEILIGEGL